MSHEGATAIVDRLLGLEATAETPIIGRGTVNTVVLVDTVDGPVIVRIAEPGRDEFRKERWAMDATRAVGIVGPRTLALGELSDGRKVAVHSYVRGRDAESTPEVWRAIGGLLRRIHAVKLAGWGRDLDRDAHFDRDWVSFVGRNLLGDPDTDALIDAGVLSADEARSCAPWIERLTHRPPLIGLCHGDVSVRNARVDEAGRVVLLDWGCARAGDVPGEELAMVVTERDPVGWEVSTLLEGYGTDWTTVRLDVRSHSLLSAFDLCRWALDQRPDRLDFYRGRARWAVDVWLNDGAWRPAPG